jgi:hypothetical protein
LKSLALALSQPFAGEFKAAIETVFQREVQPQSTKMDEAAKAIHKSLRSLYLHNQNNKYQQ